RAPDRGRSQIFRQGELGLAGRHAESAASARPPHRRAASARRHGRRDGAAAAAHGAIVEPARLRRQALRSDCRGAGGMSAAAPRVVPSASSLPLLVGALIVLLALKLAVLAAFGPAIAPDSRDYIEYADRILGGTFRQVDLVNDALPLTLYRPIGYPAVIAAAKIIAPAHWAWAVILFQFVVSLVATAMVYRLARCFGLGLWLSLGAATAYATSLQFVVDQAIASDSLCASTFTIAACIVADLALRRVLPRPLVLLAAGVLIAASFLARD